MASLSRLIRCDDQVTLTAMSAPDSGNDMPRVKWNVDRWIGTFNGGTTWRSSPDGITWTAIANPGVGTLTISAAEFPMAAGANGRLVVLGGLGSSTTNAAYTDNGGVSWVAVTNSSFPKHLTYLPLQKAFVACHYVGLPLLTRSLDNGVSWTEIEPTIYGAPEVSTLEYGDMTHLVAAGPGTLIGVIDIAVGLGGLSDDYAFLALSNDAGSSFRVVALLNRGVPDQVAYGNGSVVLLYTADQELVWFDL